MINDQFCFGFGFSTSKAKKDTKKEMNYLTAVGIMGM